MVIVLLLRSEGIFNRGVCLRGFVIVVIDDINSYKLGLGLVYDMDNDYRAVRQFESLLRPRGESERLPDPVDTSGWRLIGTHVYDPVAETVIFERASDLGDRK